MATVFWDSKGIILIDYKPAGTSVTGENYANVIIQLKAAIKDKNSAEGVIAPAGAKVTGATIRMWLLNKFISFLAVLTWKTGLKKM